MQEFELTGELRTDLGKKATKALRSADRVPCVIYGGDANVNFSVEEKLLSKLLITPNVYLVNLTVSGKTYQVVLKEAQYHPVSDRPLHVDFYQVFADKAVTVEIPVKLQGFSVGVQAGGKLIQVVRKLKINAIPSKLPEIITIDVTNLGLGKAIKVKELSFDEYKVMNAKEVVVAQVKVTRASKATETDAAK